jgi:radical SAM protein with 4Fe4S-binding SPASM domain
MIESFRKPYNLFAAGYSYFKSAVTGKADINFMPVSVSVELTNHCNLNCPQCYSGSGMMTRKRGFMDIGLYRKTIKELSPWLYNVNLYFQGEPMLHPQFFSFFADWMKFDTVVSTNGHFLSEENSERIVKTGLTKLIVSLDGIDQKTYSAYRVNGCVKSVIDGLKNVTYARQLHNSSTKIEIQFLVNRFNEHQIPQVRQLAKSVSVSLSLKSMQITDREDMSAWLPSDRRFRRYKAKGEGYDIKSSLPDRCARLWFNPVVTWDGKVVPCCFDKDAEYVLGDLNIDSFREIWNGPKYRIFRKSILTGRNMIEMCRNCTSGLRGVRY